MIRIVATLIVLFATDAHAAMIYVTPSSYLVPTLGETAMMALMVLMVAIAFSRFLQPGNLSAARHRQEPPTAMTMVSGVNTYNASISVSGTGTFTGVPVGTYTLTTTVGGQNPTSKIPVITSDDVITYGFTLHADTDNDMKEMESLLNKDLDGNGTIEDLDDDIDGDGVTDASDSDSNGDGINDDLQPGIK